MENINAHEIDEGGEIVDKDVGGDKRERANWNCHKGISKVYM